MLEELIGRAGLTPPYISVIIPVYNVEKCLPRTLDALVGQTLKEIEILCVNDCSPDGSQAVLDDYAARYPGRVIPVMHEENCGPSKARYTGVKHARSPYVMFCDGDDYFDPSACARALETALSGDCDLVGLNVLRVDEKTGDSLPYTTPRQVEKHEVVRSAQSAFWNFLFDRNLLQDESLFINQYFEDAAVTPRIMAAAKKVGWVEGGVQYYYCVRENSTMTTFFGNFKMWDCLNADTLLWSYAKAPYKQDFAYRITKRMEHYHHTYPSMFVASAQHIHKLFPELKPFLPGEFPELILQRLEDVMALKDLQPMPCRVYLNGFAAGARDMAAYKAGVLPEGFEAETVVLDETNCDVSTAPACIRRAWDENRYDDVAAYFAMVRIEEEGGMYAAPGSCLTANIDSLRYDQAFFCAAAEQEVSLHFFGGSAGNGWMKRMLALAESRADTLQGAVCEVLLAEGNVRLTGAEEHAPDRLHILSGMQSTLRHAAGCCYVNRAGAGEKMVVIPQSLYDAAMEAIAAMENEIRRSNTKNRQAMAELKRNINGLKGQLKGANEKRKTQREKIDVLRQKLMIQREKNKTLRRQTEELRTENQLQREKLRGMRLRLDRTRERLKEAISVQPAPSLLRRLVMKLPAPVVAVLRKIKRKLT